MLLTAGLQMATPFVTFISVIKDLFSESGTYTTEGSREIGGNGPLDEMSGIMCCVHSLIVVWGCITGGES